MTQSDNDDLSPPEQIAADFESGEIEFEEAAIKLLTEICLGIWAIAHDTNAIVEMRAASGETKH